MKRLIVLTVFAAALSSFLNVPSSFSTANVIINEVELNPSGTDTDAEKVELYNPTNAAVDVSGWKINSTAGRTATVVINDGTVIPTNGHLVIGSASQWLDNVGETIILTDKSGSNADSAGPFSDEDNDANTWQRSPDGSSNWIIASSTLGSANAGTDQGTPETEPEQPAEVPAPTPPDDSEPHSDSGATLKPDINKILKTVIIDVGQGLSQLVILPNGKTMLIDGGDRDKGDEVLAALQKQNVTKIDVIVATHPHADHIGGLVDLLKSGVSVGEVIDSGQFHTTQTFEDFIDVIEAKHIPLKSFRDGDSIDLDPDVELDVLNPPTSLPDEADNEEDFNNNSVVILLTYGQFKALFPADMQEENENRLASSGKNIESDVLVAGHHGSRTSSSSAFLAKVSPRVVIISSGANNTYGHPHKEALDRIQAAGSPQIFRTDMDGSIVINTLGDGQFTLETTESEKTVVIPELETAILAAGIGLTSMIAILGRGRGLWKSSRQA